MKKILSLMITSAVLLSIGGCGDNKTREKLIGTTVVNSNSATGTTTTPTSGGSYTANPSAASVTALYNVAYAGLSAGAVSFAPRFSPAFVPTAQTGGLSTPNAQGEYSITNSLMNITLAFKYNSKNVILKTENAISGTDVRIFQTKAISAATEMLVPSNINALIGFLSDPYNTAAYVPAVWSYYDTGDPIEWYTIAKADVTSAASMTTVNTALTNFMMTKFPTSMVNTVSGSIPGGSGTMSMTTTSAMTQGKPTNANPATMTGSGTISFTGGETWTVSVSLSVGDSGPVGGTQSFVSSTGQTGTMTFGSDGSMSGSIYSGATKIATIQIGSNGSGTYTDLAANKTYDVSGAKP